MGTLKPLVERSGRAAGPRRLRSRPKRRQWENIWLRTKRYDASGAVRSGTGGICYVLWGSEISPAQRAALAAVGIK